MKNEKQKRFVSTLAGRRCAQVERYANRGFVISVVMVRATSSVNKAPKTETHLGWWWTRIMPERDGEHSKPISVKNAWIIYQNAQSAQCNQKIRKEIHENVQRTAQQLSNTFEIGRKRRSIRMGRVKGWLIGVIQSLCQQNDWKSLRIVIVCLDGFVALAISSTNENDKLFDGFWKMWLFDRWVFGCQRFGFGCGKVVSRQSASISMNGNEKNETMEGHFTEKTVRELSSTEKSSHADNTLRTDLHLTPESLTAN